LLDKGYLILNLEKDPIGFFNDYPEGLAPPLTPGNKAALIYKEVHWKSLINSWDIDCKSRNITCNGIDVFQGIFERCFRGIRVFSSPYDTIMIRGQLNDFVPMVDREITAIDYMKEKLNVPIQYLSVSVPHYPPWSGIRDYFSHIDNPDQFSFLHVTSIYENYLHKMKNTSLETITALNLTRYKNSRAAFLGGSELFEKYASKRLTEESMSLSSDNKVASSKHKENLDQNLPYVQAIIEAKKQGKKILCILGKIPYDLAVPSMSGVFSDFKVWAQETEKYIAASTDLFGVIKPHPHEMNMAISQYANESFLDFFTTKSPNLYLLEHNEASLDDLYGLVDVFILWNGTSVIELSIARQNIIVCDDWAPKDYPIGLYKPNSKSEYFKALHQANKWSQDSQEAKLREKLAYLFIDYMKSESFYVKNIGVNRSATNINYYDTSINIDKVYTEAKFPTQNWEILEKLIQ
jgi:hypothetical protein